MAPKKPDDTRTRNTRRRTRGSGLDDDAKLADVLMGNQTFLDEDSDHSGNVSSMQEEPIGELQASAYRALEAFDTARRNAGRKQEAMDEPHVEGADRYSAQEIADTTPPFDPEKGLAAFDAAVARGRAQARKLKL